MIDASCIELTAIRGVQAGSAYYVVICPLKHLPRLLPVNSDAPALRAQRPLNNARIPPLARYITGNPLEYVLPALCASIDGEFEFEPAGATGALRTVGKLRIALSARMLINDGQHRRAALELAVRQQPELGDETISIVVFPDRGLRRAQQMFADLNGHAIRPTRSLCLSFDHRDARSELTRQLIGAVPLFRELTSFEQSGLSARSPYLFTFSSLHGATLEFLARTNAQGDGLALATRFWSRVIDEMPDWRSVGDGVIGAGDIRARFVHAHSVVWQAIAFAGAELVNAHPEHWSERLAGLRLIDWSRSNNSLWGDRLFSAGKISKARSNVLLTANVILRSFGVPFPAESDRAELAMSDRVSAWPDRRRDARGQAGAHP